MPNTQKERCLKMKKVNKNDFFIAICMLIAFALWTLTLTFVDVQAIGPDNSTIGLATFNKFVHSLTGVHLTLYNITDQLGLLPIFIVLCFGMLGAIQLIKRKSLFKVDFSLLILGAFYAVVFALFITFETFIVNYRPI